MLQRFIIYGIAGWATEVLFTGLGDFIDSGDPALKARTHFWMFPITAVACLLMELVLLHFSGAPFLLRAPLHIIVIYAVEYLSGATLYYTMKARPWDYSGRGWDVQGFIRLDYAPFWLLAAWLFERVYPEILALPQWI